MFHCIYNNIPDIFNLLAIQTRVVALGTTVLGTFALIREQGSRVRVVYFILKLGMSVWFFACSWLYSAIDALALLAPLILSLPSGFSGIRPGTWGFSSSQ